MIRRSLLPTGTINKVGEPVNGIQTYVLKDQNLKYTFSVPADKTDKFEKLYEENNNAINICTPPWELEQEKQRDKFKKEMTIKTVVGGLIGIAIPAAIAIASKGSKLKRSILGVLGSAVCGTVGALGMAFLSYRNAAMDFVKPTLIRMAEISKEVKALGVKKKVEHVEQQ